ncbi:MAG: iron-sulfur cluster assembly accessory protein, partial [Weeksellaceae bacterium]|nr:iron-sulfur cluster assembly accessory protein [Weeksellaceae bacterium]
EGTNLEESYVQVGVESGGCSGLSYRLSFGKNRSEDDQLYEDKGVKIIVDRKSYLYLTGTILEYSGGLNGKGFVFNNPNANRTCGCGDSFAV